MKIIKCGGSSISSLTDRNRLYQEIKNSDDKIVLVVSAFIDSSYSTKSLSNLIKNNYTYEMKQQLITLGEVISSIIVCNELLNCGIDASVILKEEIGIYVHSSEKMDYIDRLDNTILKEKISDHKVVVVPGFIGINQDKKLVSLNENGSDLTAIIVAKMLEIDEVYLYKDVLGLASINPKENSNYKLYKSISYSLMQQIIIHGNKLLSSEAIIYAKDNDIKINIIFYLNHTYKTTISKFSNEKVIVFQQYNNDVYIDGYNNKDIIENILINNNLLYDFLLPCNSFIKIVTSFNNQNQIIQTLHNSYLKGEL